MGCLSVTARRVGGIDASIERIGGINATASWLGGIGCDASRLGGIGMGTSRMGGIRFFTSLICDIGVGSYLRVTPVEMQWIDIDLSVDYNVITNKAWNVS